MQKFPIDSHSNENFICLFFRPPGAANPQTTSFPSLVSALPWAKISRRSHHPALRYPQPYKKKQKNKQKKANLISRQTLRYATLYGEIKNYDDMLSRFHVITERYGRTDGQICYINIARQYADAQWKSDSICQSYAQMKKGPVFWLTE